MKQTALTAVCATLLALQAGGQTLVTVDPSVRYQTMRGLGGALAFGESYFGTLPQGAFDHLMWRFFDDLRANLLRVRNEIEPVNDNTNPDSINWSTVRSLPDTVAVKIIRAARTLNPRVQVLATPWSPPGWMKTNDTTVNGGHLRPGFEAELAEWLRIFLALWEQRHGVRVDHVSIQNEPSWVADYESCIYTPAELNRAIRIVIPRLGAWGFTADHLAPDDASMEASLTFADSLLQPPEVRLLLTGYAVYNYSTPYADLPAKVGLMADIEQRCRSAF